MPRLPNMLLAALIVALPATPGRAQTAEQRSALASLADATLLDDRCGSMSIDTLVVGILMAANGIEPGDMGRGGKFNEFVFSRMAETAGKLDALNERGVCALAGLAFGADGLQVRRLMKND